MASDSLREQCAKDLTLAGIRTLVLKKIGYKLKIGSLGKSCTPHAIIKKITLPPTVLPTAWPTTALPTSVYQTAACHL
eukprot:scaffold82539_cov42-Cyclotella_meneghiniana.AAC.2